MTIQRDVGQVRRGSEYVKLQRQNSLEEELLDKEQAEIAALERSDTNINAPKNIKFLEKIRTAFASKINGNDEPIENIKDRYRNKYIAKIIGSSLKGQVSKETLIAALKQGDEKAVKEVMEGIAKHTRMGAPLSSGKSTFFAEKAMTGNKVQQYA